MNFKITFRLLLAVLLLGSLLYIEKRKASTVVESTELSPFQTRGDVTFLKMERGAFSMQCEKEGAYGDWYLTEPIKARADGGKIDKILTILDASKGDKKITPEQRMNRELAIEDYGLLRPSCRFVIGNRNKKVEVLVGDKTPLDQKVYVKLANGSDIIPVPVKILDVIPNKLEDVRERSVVCSDLSRIERMEIQRAGGGFIQLVHKGGNWFVQQPISDMADNGKVTDLLNYLSSLNVLEFVWDPVASKEGDNAIDIKTDIKAGGAREIYGLSDDAAAIRIMLREKGDDLGQEIMIGKVTGENKDRVFARCSDSESIFCISKDVLDIFSVGVDQLRTHYVFPFKPGSVRYAHFRKGETSMGLLKSDISGWGITEPVKWKADDLAVNDIIKQITNLKIDSFLSNNQTNIDVSALESPMYLMELNCEASDNIADFATSEEPDVKTKEPVDIKMIDSRILLFGDIKKDCSYVVAKFKNKDEFVTIQKKELENICARFTNPLLFKDRTMLALVADSVKKITLVNGGKQQVVKLNDSGKWEPSMNMGSATNANLHLDVSEDVINDLLLNVANLRALRIEAHAPKNIEAYGLDRSVTTITFGLSGEEGIQNTLIIGFRARTEGRYAMIQGQNVVFVLSNKQVASLTRDLCKVSNKQ